MTALLHVRQWQQLNIRKKNPMARCRAYMLRVDCGLMKSYMFTAEARTLADYIGRFHSFFMEVMSSLPLARARVDSCG